MKMQRFKAVLPTRYSVVSDEQGEFVKYSDVAALIAEALEWNWNTDEGLDTIPSEVVAKFEEFM